MRFRCSVIPVLFALATLVAAPVLAGSPVSVEQLQHSIGMGDMPIWGEVAAEIHTIMDSKGFVEAKRIFVGNAMKSMIPEADRMKLMKLMPDEKVPVTVLLMALDAWGKNALDELLKSDPSSWWSPNSNGGMCGCEVVLDKGCCMVANTCAWVGGQCGCR